jgi:hypothetical protein
MRTKGAKITMMILLVLVIGSAMIAAVMLLWNWLIPDLFNGPEITFWQAAGLLLLSKILFVGFYGKGKKHWGEHRTWKKEFIRKVSDMSPDEREKLKQSMRSKWGHWGCHVPEDIPDTPDKPNKDANHHS